MYLEIFVVAAFAELYFFMLQRSALELSTKHKIDPVVGRSMLPNWYLFLYVVRIAKYGALFGLYTQQGFATALSYWAASMLLTTFAPIPREHCKNLFRKQVEKLHNTDPLLAAKLTLILMED
jgi:hypothetical protein